VVVSPVPNISALAESPGFTFFRGPKVLDRYKAGTGTQVSGISAHSGSKARTD